MLRDFQNFLDLIETSDHSVSPVFKASLERIWNYLAYSMCLDGYSVLNNDSERDYNRPLVNKAAATYQRANWLYITSNGKFGQKLEGQASRAFAWADQVVMRGGIRFKQSFIFNFLKICIIHASPGF